MRIQAVSMIFLMAGATLVAAPGSGLQGTPVRGHGALPDFDTRLPATKSERAAWALTKPSPVQLTVAREIKASQPGLTLHWDGLSGSVGWIAAPPGDLLASPEPVPAEERAIHYLSDNRELFGLTPADVDGLRLSSVVRLRGGGTHVHLIQSVGGIEVFGSHVVVNLDHDGSVRSAGARLFANARAHGAPRDTAGDAVRSALDNVYPWALFTGTAIDSPVGAAQQVHFDGAGLGYAPRARLVVFPLADSFRLAWEVSVAEPTLYTDYVVLIDARDGSLLFRENQTRYAEASYIEDRNRPVAKREEYSPANYVTTEIPALTTESPAGWIDGDGTSLGGNNAAGRIGYWWNPIMTDAAADFSFAFNTTESSLVNTWWWSNAAHDEFYRIGFDEGAGNLQIDNFGAEGTGGDPLKVVQYVAGPRNPQFATIQPDGGNATLNLGWADCRFCGDHDGITTHDSMTGDRAMGYARALIFHEYTHLVVGRLAGGRAVTGCANGGAQVSALNEATSDFFGQSFHEPHPRLRSYGEGTGVGRDPRNDFTYSEFCKVWNGGCEIHTDGMIWSGTLWDLRESFLALDPVGGLDALHRLVLEGWATAPCDPSYLQMREALLEADTVMFGGAHLPILYNVFATRGMGSNASTTGASDTAPVADFTVEPGYSCAAPDAPAVLSATPVSNNRVELTYSAPGASGIEIWRESLDNPHDRPSVVGRTSNLELFEDDTVDGGRSYRYHAVALGEGGTPCRSGLSGTADVVASGSCAGDPVFTPHLTATGGGDTCQVTLSWDPADPACPGQLIVYNVYRAPTPGFDPSERLLVGRTTSTSFSDAPPLTGEYPFDEGDMQLSTTPTYLVIAQGGTTSDPPDHRIPDPPSQLLQWAQAVPTSTRETVVSWDFDSGPDGWTFDNSRNPTGGWVLVDPSPTWFAGALLAPDEPAGGSGMAWVTGNGGAGSLQHDCDGENLLISPTWDATDGATLLSFDYWTWVQAWKARIGVEIDNGLEQVRVDVAALNTTQPFDTSGRYGWQRAELNLAEHIAPTSTMSVTFRSFCGSPATVEHGIDTVRVERATACAQPGLRFDGVTVDDTPPGWGNGNLVLEPGETARLQVRLTNDGSSTTFSPVGFISTAAPGVLIHEASADFPDLAPDASADSQGDGFTVSVPASATCGASIVFDFQFVDASGTTSRAVWNPVLEYLVTETVFEDDFESDRGWTPQGTVGRGRWVRGVPVGTLDGPNQANPDTDSPFDVGDQCYVTENGVPGGVAGTTDVDSGGATVRLSSPLFDLSGFKNARIDFDLWLYDNSGSTPSQDYSEQRVYVASGGIAENHLTSVFQTHPTGSWSPHTIDLTRLLPLTSMTGVHFFAWDTGPDHIVEVGVDNFVVEGDRSQCDATGVALAPNGIGDSLRAAKAPGVALLSWASSPIDGSHDGAAYYRVHSSSTAETGFSVVDTAADNLSARPLDSTTEFYLISAVNSVGTSGDEPAP